MTHQRAIEAGARALATKRKFEFPSLVRHFASGSKVGVALSDSAAVIDAYREFLAAEGFVVVSAAELQYIAQNSGERTIRGMARALITAAQQEQNDAGE